MSDVQPHADFEAAVEAFEWSTARTIAQEAEPAERDEMMAVLEEAQTQAGTNAEQLAARIQSLARADHYEGLLALADDPATPRLLGLLAAEIQRGAQVHLDGAKRRQERFQAAAIKHMEAASDALLLLDTTKARAEIDRIDIRWLDAEQQANLARLKSQIEEAAAERRELDARTAEVLRDHHPSQGSTAPQTKRRAERTPTQRRGCTTTALLVLATVAAGLFLGR